MATRSMIYDYTLPGFSASSVMIQNTRAVDLTREESLSPCELIYLADPVTTCGVSSLIEVRIGVILLLDKYLRSAILRKSLKAALRGYSNAKHLKNSRNSSVADSLLLLP